jgi:predicted phosphodiesterase
MIKLSNLIILYLIASNKDLLISKGSLTKMKSINTLTNRRIPEIREANIIELKGNIDLKVSIKKLPKKLPNKIHIPEIKL